MTSVELADAIATRDGLARAGQAGTPQFQVLQASIMTSLGSQARASTAQTYGGMALGAGVIGAIIGGLLGAALKGAVIGAIGVPLVVAGASALALKGMQ
jgi:hypothetical protein